MSKSALASLTAQYTDSENEDDQADDSGDSQNSQSSQVIIPQQNISAQLLQPKPISPVEIKKKKRNKKVRRLVSYQDDTIISDEDDDLETETSQSSESEEEKEKGVSTESSSTNAEESETPMEVDNDLASESIKDVSNLSKIDKHSKYAHYNFTLPPEPKGKPSAELVEKVRQLYEKMDSNNMDMNRLIQGRKEFRNPSIYEKLIQFCDINEFGTNYPPEIYNPHQWGPESFYEELARVQKNEMLKRQKERKETDKIEQATVLARKVEEEAKKRKSKWDQPAAVKPAIALTTTVTGTKGTVISAFGSLPKKPAA
ncbi:SAP30-binding protein-like [Teleopsis dalmanni]|uniref:SAP30-binding protein-like n=1 Tax=Teleopsis dalmanni TaxID=139649 RepID=UPI000D32B4D5|nr:SAP30-binding protein-like [Teleopsis dalmanni]